MVKIPVFPGLRDAGPGVGEKLKDEIILHDALMMNPRH